MPEEQPLQTLALLQLILESEHIVLVCELQQVEEFGRCLHDGEWGRLGIVDDYGDATYRGLISCTIEALGKNKMYHSG